MSAQSSAADFERARGSLRSAEILLREGECTDAMNRLYYAAFYAARGALARRGIHPKTHAGVSRMFGKEMVVPGLASKEEGRLLSHLRRLREKWDYVPLAVPCSRVARHLPEVRKFLRKREGR